MSTTDAAAAATMAAGIKLRVPSTHQPPGSPAYVDFAGPDGGWLAGTWHVTHSSLPLWKDKRNVNITYVNLPGGRVQDTTAYQEKAGGKVKSIAGVNQPSRDVPAAFDWRGKGWLVIATSHWEILGWGDVPSAATDGGEAAAGGHQWVVTYFSKTMFTPAGIDVYSRKKEGLPAGALEAVKAKLAALQDAEMKGLVGSMFEVKQTDD